MEMDSDIKKMSWGRRGGDFNPYVFFVFFNPPTAPPSLRGRPHAIHIPHKP